MDLVHIFLKKTFGFTKKNKNGVKCVTNSYSASECITYKASELFSKASPGPGPASNGQLYQILGDIVSPFTGQ